MAESTDMLLEERGKTHGEYSEHARCTQAILRALRAERNWDSLPDIIRETCHMVAHKLGRVVTGNPYVQDHYDDIAGYARLVSQRLKPDGSGLLPEHAAPAPARGGRSEPGGDPAPRAEDCPRAGAEPGPGGYMGRPEPTGPGTPEDGGHHALQPMPPTLEELRRAGYSLVGARVQYVGPNPSRGTARGETGNVVADYGTQLCVRFDGTSYGRPAEGDYVPLSFLEPLEVPLHLTEECVGRGFLTRDGHAALIRSCMDRNGYPIWGFVGGEAHVWTVQGRWCDLDRPDALDLVLPLL